MTTRLLFLLVTLSFSSPSSASGPAVKASAFTDITRETHLDFVHDAGLRGNYFVPESLGAGGALFDYDGDGDLDVYLVNGARLDDSDPTTEPLRNRLFRQDADGTFRDVTAASGLGDTGYGMGVAIGDVDNDSAPDVYVTNYGPDVLYRNQGDGSFRDVTAVAGIDNPGWGSSAVFFDPDLDGDLDLYVANYLALDAAVVCSDLAGRPDYCGPGSFEGVRDRLFRNNGDGSWTDVSRSAGMDRVTGKGLGVVSADFNGDHRPDVFVANDGQPNLLWLNRGTTGEIAFEDRALEMGVAVNAIGRTEAGMGIALGDADGDGAVDLFVSHLRTETNTLYRHADDVGFLESTAAAGLAGPSLPLTGFGTGFFDADNDGDLDLAVVNGRVTRGPIAPAADGAWKAYSEPNLFFRNDDHGRFSQVGVEGGALTQQVENSRALIVGDVDNDGGVDLLVTQGGGRTRLLRNSQPRGHWLGARVLDGARAAIGAEARTNIRADTDDRQLLRLVTPGYSYLASNDSRLHFGLADTTRLEVLEVRWPDGRTLLLHDLAVNQWLNLTPPTDR